LKKKNSFWGNVSLILVGSVFAQVISAIALVVLARIYTPDDLGVLGSYVATIMILGCLSLLRYDLAIPLPKRDEDGAKVLTLSLCILTILSCIAGIGCWGYGEKMTEICRVPNLLEVIWVVPFGIFGIGLGLAITAWMSRRGHFHGVSLSLCLQSVTQAVSQIGMGFGLLGALGLVLGNWIGQIAAGIYNLRIIWQKDRQLFKGVSIQALSEIASKYRRFPLVSFWAGCAMILNHHLPILLMSGLFGKAYAGFYLVGQRVLHMPIALISRAVGGVFLPEYARTHGTEESDKIASGLFRKLILLGFPFQLLIGLTAPITIPLIFGEKWAHAGWMAAWLAPWLALSLVSSPISTIPLVHGQQGREMLAQLGLMLSRMIPFWLLGNTWEPDEVFQVFAISTTVSSVLYLFWIASLAGETLVSIVLFLGNALMRSALLLISPLCLHYFFQSNWLTFAVVALIASLWLMYLCQSKWRPKAKSKDA